MKYKCIHKPFKLETKEDSKEINTLREMYNKVVLYARSLEKEQCTPSARCLFVGQQYMNSLADLTLEELYEELLGEEDSDGREKSCGKCQKCSKKNKKS